MGELTQHTCGSLVPGAEGADSQGEPGVPSLGLCGEGKIGKNSRGVVLEGEGVGGGGKKKMFGVKA